MSPQLLPGWYATRHRCNDLSWSPKKRIHAAQKVQLYAQPMKLPQQSARWHAPREPTPRVPVAGLFGVPLTPSYSFSLSLFLSYSRRCAPCCCFCRTGLCARVLWWWRKLHQKQKEDASLFWDFGVIFVCDLICDFRDATKKNKTWCPLIIL